MSWNVGAKGRQGARTFAPSRWPPWLRDGRRGAGAAAAGELEKKQAAAAGELGKKNASGARASASDARTRKWTSERLGRPVSFPLANSQGQAGHFAPPC